MNSELIPLLERPLYLETPKAWSPDENELLLAVLVPSEISEIQSLEDYQELLMLRLKAMVKENEADQIQPWKEMVQARCSHLHREIPITPQMSDDEIIQSLAQSPLVQIPLVAETDFPIQLHPISTEIEDYAIAVAVETTLEEWLIWLVR